MNSKYTVRCLFFTIIFIVINSVNTYSQHLVSGEVVDIKNGKPIAYTSVYIIGTSTGTLTNDYGKFTFYIPDEFLNDTLCFSLLGYKPYKVLAGTVSGKTGLYIPMIPVYYTIKEVEITPERTNAYKIVKMAMDSLNARAPDFKYIAEGFYREYIKENNTYARAIEAAISIFHDGEHHLGDHFFPIRINGIRSSEDYLSNFARAGNYNQLSLFLTNNFDYKWFFTPLEETLYEVDSMIMMDSKLVYVISGTPEKTRKKTYHWTETVINFETGLIERIKKKAQVIIKRNTNMYYSYQFYIQADDYSILKMSYHDTLYVPLILDYGKVNNLYYSINSNTKHIEFFKYNEDWYPRYFRDIKDIGFYKNKDSALFISMAKYSDMMINNVFINNIREFYPDEQPDLFADLFAQKEYYDPSFWQNYNYIADDALRQTVLDHLNIIKNEGNDENSDSAFITVVTNDSVQTDTVEVAIITNNDLVFKIQIMAVGNKIPTQSPVFKGLKNIEYYFHNGLYKYTWGTTYNLQEALAFQEQLRNIGFGGAFVVPFYKGKRISMDEAIQIYNIKI